MFAPDLNGRALVAAQVWMWGPPSQAETTLEEAIATCQRFGIPGILVKAWDGADWMSRFDASAAAVSGPEHVAAQAAAVRAARLWYGVWGVMTPRNPEGQAAIIAACRQAPGVSLVVLDVEPYGDGYWGDQPEGMAAALLDDVLRRAPEGAPLIVQPDHRPSQFPRLHPAEWVERTAAIAPQAYWPGMQRPWLDVVQEAVEVCAHHQRPMILTVPGDAGPDELAAALDYADLRGAAGVIGFRLGTFGLANLEVLGGLAARWEAPEGSRQPGPVASEAEAPSAVARALGHLAEARRLRAEADRHDLWAEDLLTAG